LHGLCKEDRDLARKLSYEYDVVLVDIGKWDKHMDLAEGYGADLRDSGVPYLTVLDADGKVLANQRTDPFETDADGKRGHDPKKVLEFLTTHQAPYPEAQHLLDRGLEEARASGRRLFVHFGAPW
jgi:hypothetical protein